MGEIKVARIRFKGETTDYTIETSKIYFKNQNGKKTPFTPQHEKDFDKGKWYFATWICEDDECESSQNRHTHLYKTSILLLAESEEDLEKKIKKRVIYPNFKSKNDLDTSTPISGESSESDEEQRNREIPKDVLFEYKKNQLMQKRNIMSLIENDNHEQNEPSGVQITNDKGERSEQPTRTVTKQKRWVLPSCSTDEDDLDRRSLNDITPVPPQSKNQRKEGTVDQLPILPQHSVEKSCESTVGQSASNVNNERAVDRPQTVRSFKKKYQKHNDQHFILDVEAKRYDEKNSETYLGLDIWINSDTWLTLQLQKKVNIYIRDLADILWTPIMLVNRYFDKSRISVKKIVEGAPREEIEKDKLQLLRELLDDHLVKKNVSEQERKAIQARVRSILSKKNPRSQTTLS